MMKWVAERELSENQISDSISSDNSSKPTNVTINDFIFIKVLGKGSFGKVC